MRVYWIRHAETDLNLQGIVQGSGVNSALNATGEAQALALFEAYKTLNVDAIYVSALQRTQLTFAPWQESGHTLTICPELNELSWGDLEGRPNSDETRQIYKNTVELWQSGNSNAHMPNGESAHEAWARAYQFIQRLVTHPAHHNHTILVCTHGRMLRVILSQLLRGNLQSMEEFHNNNTAINVTHYSPESGWSAERLNCTAHLQNVGLKPFYAHYL